MIEGLDHIVLASRDLEADSAAYQVLLGRPRDGFGSAGGAAYCWFRLSNMALVIAAEREPGPVGDLIGARLRSAGEGLAAIAFRVARLDRAHGLASRRGLAPASAVPWPALTGGSDEAATVGATVLSEAATHGVRVILIERTVAGATGSLPNGAAVPGNHPPAALSGLDHVVIRSPNPERAVALYGGRLGLDLRLDRTNPEWGSRLLFFRCGDLVVEVVHDLGNGISDQADDLWGLSWRAVDVDAAHARLAAAGVAISGVRAGRRPGTRVFSIRDPSTRVPTLVLGLPPTTS